jgi:NAD(P)-dependent dehydrogenase (short-subunit alcohol dehydrogenase family)
VALAEAGAHVTLAARRTQKLEETAAAFASQGWTADILTLDIADTGATRDALAARDPYDILVNSAGLAIHSPATETDRADYDRVTDINTRGAYFLLREVAKRLIETGRPGSLMTISSQMAHVGGIERAVYCASKHAVEGMTKAMAIEWGPHKIRVNTLCPTFIRTPLTEPTFDNPERVAWIEEKIKLGRTGEVEDIMGGVVFLASDASALVTGTALLIDGGWTAD